MDLCTGALQFRTTHVDFIEVFVIMDADGFSGAYESDRSLAKLESVSLENAWLGESEHI